MDYGDDPLISATYAQENAAAVRMMKPDGGKMIEALRNRRAGGKLSLESLRDSMITPCMLVAAGMKWDSLQRKHGTTALVQYGFRWPDMMAAGFRGNALRTLTEVQLSQLGVNAARAMECRPRIADISSLCLGAEKLHDMGWTVPMLKAIGLDRNSMVCFGYPLQQWISVFGAVDFHDLGFDTYANCATAGWSRGDIQLALAPPRLSATTMACTASLPQNLDDIRFI